MRRPSLCLILIVLAFTGCARHVTRESAPEHPSWSYEGPHGPSHWADDYPACGEPGESPIDIVAAEPAALPALEPRYPSAQGTVRDTGHAIQVDTQGGTLRVGDREYLLRQFHFHIPSEHRFDGARYEAVVHLVHSDEAGSMAVVGVPVTSGAANPLMDRVLNALEAGSPVAVTDVLPQNLAYYSYEGSLTTPPCTGGVQWFVLDNPITWSSAQINRLGEYYRGNVRPTQPVGDRKVLKSGE